MERYSVQKLLNSEGKDFLAYQGSAEHGTVVESTNSWIGGWG